MQIIIDIPEKEFGIDIEDRFQDFFKRLRVETKEHMFNGTNLVCGAYELETIEMFMQVLANYTPLPKGHGALIDISDIDVIELEDSTKIIRHEKGDEVDVYISAPIIIEADTESEEIDADSN